jgi:hypothetical protein
MQLFYSYSHADEALRDRLDKHLSALKRSGVISEWHDRKILPGDDFDATINEHLEKADIVLFLVSADFLASSYISDIEVSRAMERHQKGEARVIPIILQPVDLGGVPFEHLQRLPKDGLAVTEWPNQEAALSNIALGIRRAAMEMSSPISSASANPGTGFIEERRLLDAGVAGEVPVGESREVLAMIRREGSAGLVEVLDDAQHDRASAYSVQTKDVRTSTFGMLFYSSSGRYDVGTKVKVELSVPGVEVSDSPAAVTVRRSNDTQALAFLIRATTSGKQTLKVRVICEDEEIVAGLLRTSFVEHGGPGGPGGPMAGARVERDASGRTVLVLAEADLILNLISKTGLRLATA